MQVTHKTVSDLKFILLHVHCCNCAFVCRLSVIVLQILICNFITFDKSTTEYFTVTVW